MLRAMGFLPAMSVVALPASVVTRTRVAVDFGAGVSVAESTLRREVKSTSSHSPTPRVAGVAVQAVCGSPSKAAYGDALRTLGPRVSASDPELEACSPATP